MWVCPADVCGVAEVAPAQADLALHPAHPRQVEQLGGAALLQPGQQGHPGAATHTHLDTDIDRDIDITWIPELKTWIHKVFTVPRGSPY